MKSTFAAACLLCCSAVFAQKAASEPELVTGPGAAERTLKIDASVTTSHEVTIKGQRVPYKVTAGTLPVWDDEGKTIAGVFYTYFERTGVDQGRGHWCSPSMEGQAPLPFGCRSVIPAHGY